MWIGLVAMKTWMRDLRASARASAASMSSLRVRARERWWDARLRRRLP